MPFDGTPIQDRAQGRWRGVLAALGVEGKYLSGKHGACPICKNGTDRFRFDDKQGNGTYYCSKCGPGNGVGLVMEIFGCDFVGAVKMIEPHIGGAALVVKKGGRTDADKREAMAHLWQRATPLDGNDLASRYLRRRGLTVPDCPGSLRFVPDMPFYPADGSGRQLHPCMLAKFAAADGKSAILHRSFMAEPGVRAAGIDKGMMMPGIVPAGGAVRLASPLETMGVGEGVETAIAAIGLHGLPVWACLSTVALMKWEPPSICKHVIIFGDTDPKFGGQMAGYALAYRLAARKDLTVEVRFAPEEYASGAGGKVDWADVAEVKMSEILS